jgi:hypothetical protein
VPTVENIAGMFLPSLADMVVLFPICKHRLLRRAKKVGVGKIPSPLDRYPFVREDQHCLSARSHRRYVSSLRQMNLHLRSQLGSDSLRRDVSFMLAHLSHILSKHRRMSVDLARYGKKIYSQNDEDGIIQYIFSCVKPTNRFFVEIGVGPAWKDGRFLNVEESGLECHSRLLADHGWNGITIDGKSYPARLNVKSEFITAENINSTLLRYNVPHSFDLFSLDVDGNDYWIWNALTYDPRVVVIEYNASLAAHESKTIKYDPNFRWSKYGCTKYYGTSLLALKKLGDKKGYTLIYANGVNAFFVKSTLISNPDEFVYERIYRYRNLHGDAKGDEEWVYV